MYKLFVSLRYLRTSRVTVLPIACVTLGVVALLLVTSVMGGFSRDLRARIRGTTSHIAVFSASGMRHPFGSWEAVAEVVRKVPGVVAVAPHLEWPVLRSPTMEEAQIVGIDPTLEPQVGEWAEYLLDGKTPDFTLDGAHTQIPPAIVGCDMWSSYRSRDYVILIDRSELVLRDPTAFRRVLLLARSIMRLLNQGDRFNLIAFGGGIEELFPDRLQERGQRTLRQAEEFLSRLSPGGKADTYRAMRHALAYRPIGDRGYRMVVVSAGAGADQVTGVKDGAHADDFREAAPYCLSADGGADQDPREALTGHYRGWMVQVVTGRIGSGMDFHPVHQTFELVGKFKSGFAEYDSGFIYVPLEEAQKLLGAEGQVTRLCVAVKDPEEVAETKKLVKDALAKAGLGSFGVITWEDEKASFLRAVSLEKSVSLILQACVLVVSGICILAIMLMVVREKTRDIGIMRSLGATVPGIAWTFLTEGLLIGLIGTLLGWIIGFDFADHLNDASDYVYAVTGWTPFPKDLYMLDKIPTVPVYWEALWIGAFAVVVSVLFSVYPAVKAALLHPVEALRYE